MKRILLAAALVCSAEAVTLETINSKPPSRAKNFLIWQFFNQKITPEEAQSAFYQIDGVSVDDLHRYAQKGNEPEIRYTSQCMTTRPGDLLAIKKLDCLELALTPYKFSKLEPSERKALYGRMQKHSYKRWMKAMEGRGVADRISPAILLELFTRAGSDYRHANFNRPYSEKELSNLSKDPRFSKFVIYGVIDSELSKISRSLLHVKALGTLDAQSHFYLGLNALRHGKKTLALEHLDAAYLKYYYQHDRDKALFWHYQIAQDDKTLRQLSESFDINIYTLFAREKLGLERGNYYTSLDVKTQPPKVDITDPFEWLKILDEVKVTPSERLEALSQRYRSPQMLGVQSFIYERATRYRDQGFIMPYREYLKGLDSDALALVYAIMRQESRFIPAALSASYAMGLMQMMPFLVHAMEKEMDQKLENLDDMFDPETNLKFATKHLQWLQKSYYHPLFVAYSYNGGYGFLRNHLKTGAFGSGAYEPFMSMEMMLNSESREYGKRVLANYVIYKEILGEKVSLIKLCDSLDEPKLTDRFRKAETPTVLARH